LLYAFLDRHKNAIQEFEKTIELLPNFAEGYKNLGLMYHSNEDYEQAISSLEKALELEPYLVVP